jgi:hypothetical protein
LRLEAMMDENLAALGKAGGERPNFWYFTF